MQYSPSCGSVTVLKFLFIIRRILFIRDFKYPKHMFLISPFIFPPEISEYKGVNCALFDLWPKSLQTAYSRKTGVNVSLTLIAVWIFKQKKPKIYFLSFLDHPLSYSPLKKKSLFNWSTIDWLLWDAYFLFKNVLNIYGLFFAFFRKWVPKKWLLTPHKWTQILCWSPPNARKVHKRRKNTSPVKRYLSLCSWIRHITWIKVWQIHYKTIIKWQKARPKMTSLTTSQRHKIIQVPPIRFSCFLIDSK